MLSNFHLDSRDKPVSEVIVPVGVDTHLLHLLTEGGTVARSVFTGDTDLASAFCLRAEEYG